MLCRDIWIRWLSDSLCNGVAALSTNFEPPYGMSKCPAEGDVGTCWSSYLAQPLRDSPQFRTTAPFPSGSSGFSDRPGPPPVCSFTAFRNPRISKDALPECRQTLHNSTFIISISAGYQTSPRARSLRLSGSMKGMKMIEEKIPRGLKLRSGLLSQTLCKFSLLSY